MQSRRGTGRTSAALVGGALVAALVGGCGDDGGEGEPDTGGRTNAPSATTRTASPTDPVDADAELSETEVVGGLTSPWGVVELDGGDLMVTERDTGTILRVGREDGATSVLRTVPGVRTGSESGLLGLAMTPDSSTVLAYYTGAEDSRIVEMSWDGTTLGEPEPLFTGIPTGAGYHQGGRIAVGPDDLLYIGTGDNGDPSTAQDRDSLSGKVLRVTLDGEAAPGNPFGNAVFSLGHRNVEGLAFDDAGRLWSAEFGDDAWDEMNLLEAGGNYGWPEVEGTGGEPTYVDPVAVWRTADASPSGIAVWDGSLWLAALRGARLWEVPMTGDGKVGTPVAHLAGEHGRLRTVVPSEAGTLLVTTSNTDGRGDVRDGDDRVFELER